MKKVPEVINVGIGYGHKLIYSNSPVGPNESKGFDKNGGLQGLGSGLSYSTRGQINV